MPQRPDTAVRPRATKRGAGLRWATLAAALPACTTWPALLGGLSGVELRAPPVHSPGPAGEDRVDNDCDDQIDEPGEREQRGLFRYDRDADGAQLGDPFSACAPPAGAVPLTGVWAPTDCDDNDAARHPGAAERCLDRGDEDCDGRADCSDPDCAGLPCAEDCTDPTDNDADGLDDCADPDCPPGLCAEDCAAGGDRDRDGRAGCADPDCFGPACAEDCAAPGDEDGDGLPDCEDVDCVDACAEDCRSDADPDLDGLYGCDDPDCALRLPCWEGLGLEVAGGGRLEAQFEGYIYTYENLRTVRELRATLDLNSVRFYATPPGAAAGANCSAAVSTLTVGLSDLYHRSYWGTTSVRHTEVSGSGLSPLRAACPPPAASELAALGLQLALVVPTRPPAESPLIGLRDGVLLSVAGGDPRWAPVSLELGPVIGARVEHPSPNYAARTMFTQTAVIDGLSPLE